MAEVDWHVVMHSAADAIVVLGCPLGAALTRRVERTVQLFCDRLLPYSCSLMVVVRKQSICALSQSKTECCATGCHALRPAPVRAYLGPSRPPRRYRCDGLDRRAVACRPLCRRRLVAGDRMVDPRPS